jgi:hypothetical protein
MTRCNRIDDFPSCVGQRTDVGAPITSPHATARLLSGSGSGSRSVGSFMQALKRRLIKTIEIKMILIIKGVGLKAL